MPTIHCIARVVSDGTLAIPQKKLDELGIKPGDTLKISLNSDELSDSVEINKVDQLIYFGMFPELQSLTDGDFKSAEFHGDTDDALLRNE